MADANADITLLLRAAASGSRGDLDALMVAMYDDLRRLAAAHLRSERPDHTLQPTALVHEAYAKLVNQRTTTWNDRLHFFAVASQIIRRILVDHARNKEAVKRGGGSDRLSLDEQRVPSPQRTPDLIALDEALEQLAELDAIQSRIVELRFFGGCTVEEVSEILQIPRRTVERHWQAARAWLFERMGDSPEMSGDA
ncbi:MAG: sigma-70 family RNA polymerase sigma factor [Planctomycetes bacterium]|nr:sigma-70 family RNA polymerase sigma factor [Planctomycetota bacterium]